MKLGSLGSVFAAGGNYAYVTARVRAKKTFLLPSDTYPKLLARDVHEIARTLQEGQYKREIDELGGRFAGAQLVEMATRLNLARQYASILSWSSGELRGMVELYLQRYDVYNIKTILRGKFAGVPDEEIGRNLVPAGQLTVENLDGLAKLASLADVIDALRETPYGASLGDYVAGRGAASSLAKLENAVDKRYYKALVAAVEPKDQPKAAFKAFLERELDIIDLKTVLRLRADGITEIGDLFLDDSGEITLENATRLLRANADDFGHELEGTDIGKVVAPHLREAIDKGNLHPVTTALDAYLLQSARTFSHRYPLSILPVIDYVLRKKIEVDNLRIIASGKQSGLREETIRELLSL
ncbi:MAG: ATP synthase A1 subunit C [Euryarchaeota archaeon]|nr:ATP synthase A1 subunit C [Euryarchaeota archaeon]